MRQRFSQLEETDEDEVVEAFAQTFLQQLTGGVALNSMTSSQLLNVERDAQALTSIVRRSGQRCEFLINKAIHTYEERLTPKRGEPTDDAE